MKKEIIELTKEHWRKYSGRELSDSEAEEIIRNISQFFGLLNNWDIQEKGDKVEEKLPHPKLKERRGNSGLPGHERDEKGAT